MAVDNAHAIAQSKLWPTYAQPGDLTDVESLPLLDRGLPESTYALLVHAADSWPLQVAIKVIGDPVNWRKPLQRSYSQLLEDVHRIGNLLHSLGVGRTDAVALMAPNCAELIAGTLGAQLAGIAAPVNGNLSKRDTVQLLQRSGARVLIAAGPNLSDRIWQVAIELAREGVVDAVLALRPTEHDTTPETMPFIDGVCIGHLNTLAADHDSSRFVGTPPIGSDLAAMLHTGGTTGVPKLAAHRHRGQVDNAWMIAATPVFDEHAAVFAALPLFHANALVVSVLAPLFKGQPVLWAGPSGYRDPALRTAFWKIMAHHRISLMSAVPTVYAALAEQPVDADISALRYGIVGASPLPAAVRERFEGRTGIALVEGYGLTEATCASACSFPGTPRAGSVGQRLPYHRVRVVHTGEDGQWEDVPVGQSGRLIVSGTTVFAGYVTHPDDQGYRLDGLTTLVDGWLDTGDLAHLDSDDFIYLDGRAKDLIIRGGHNIDPAVIEEVLLSCPGVTAAAAVGRPDAHAGEVPVAYVSLAPGSLATESDLVAWAAERVSERGAAPKTITVLDELPLTAVGKPYKPALRADATRAALVEALAGTPGVRGVETTVHDGVVKAAVSVAQNADLTLIGDIVNRYAVKWTTVCTATPIPTAQ